MVIFPCAFLVGMQAPGGRENRYNLKLIKAVASVQLISLLGVRRSVFVLNFAFAG